MLSVVRKALQRQTLQKAKPTKAGSNEPAFFFYLHFLSICNPKQSYFSLMIPRSWQEIISGLARFAIHTKLHSSTHLRCLLVALLDVLIVRLRRLLLAASERLRMQLGITFLFWRFFTSILPLSSCVSVDSPRPGPTYAGRSPFVLAKWSSLRFDWDLYMINDPTYVNISNHERNEYIFRGEICENWRF
jgi:hypothetical protein